MPVDFIHNKNEGVDIRALSSTTEESAKPKNGRAIMIYLASMAAALVTTGGVVTLALQVANRSLQVGYLLNEVPDASVSHGHCKPYDRLTANNTYEPLRPARGWHDTIHADIVALTGGAPTGQQIHDKCAGTGNTGPALNHG